MASPSFSDDYNMKGESSPSNFSNKRKLSTESPSEGVMADSEAGSPPKKNASSGKMSASQQLVPVPGNPDAPLVTKRTLQNRKAQREFRKRREARVRELEERCRRFDQMGIEANSELQRLARQLKDENEALRSLVARLGFGHMIPPIMEALGAHESAMPPPQSFPPLDLSMDSWARGPDPSTVARSESVSHPSAPVKKSSNSTKAIKIPVAPASATAPMSSLTSQPAYAGLLPTNAEGVNPSLLSDTKATSDSIGTAITSKPIEQRSSSTFDNEWFAQLAQSGHDDEESTVASSAVDNTSSENASVNPILSLNFNSNKPQNKSTTNKGTAASNTLSGSAMLGANQRDFGLGLASALGFPTSSATGNSIFPMPMPSQQNSALLNPNPIPFAFNLSDPNKLSDQSWWSSMAGNQIDGDDSILDEKAQAVAQATGASNNGAPSPFDLSAFLNGGLTPGGGGFSFGGQNDSNDADNGDESQKQKQISTDDKKANESRPLNQAEHAQMFLRLLEAKMAKRSESPYAQLGFQPPQHQQQFYAQPGESSSDSSRSQNEDDSSLSPINVYSRLAQHPAFLSTNASELEELVDSIGSNQQQQMQQQKRKMAKGTLIYPPANSGLTPSIYGVPSNAGLTSRSTSSTGSPSKDLEVDEKAVSKMLGLLDRKAPRDAAVSF